MLASPFHALIQNFTSHVWIDERTIVGTDKGDMIVLEQAVLKAVLENPTEGHCIRSIASHANVRRVGSCLIMMMSMHEEEKEEHNEMLQSCILTDTVFPLRRAWWSAVSKAVCICLKKRTCSRAGNNFTNAANPYG